VAGHHINLFAAPYCLREPLRVYRDNGIDSYMALWEVGAFEEVGLSEGYIVDSETGIKRCRKPHGLTPTPPIVADNQIIGRP